MWKTAHSNSISSYLNSDVSDMQIFHSTYILQPLSTNGHLWTRVNSAHTLVISQNYLTECGGPRHLLLKCRSCSLWILHADVNCNVRSLLLHTRSVWRKRNFLLFSRLASALLSWASCSKCIGCRGYGASPADGYWCWGRDLNKLFTVHNLGLYK